MEETLPCRAAASLGAGLVLGLTVSSQLGLVNGDPGALAWLGAGALLALALALAAPPGAPGRRWMRLALSVAAAALLVFPGTLHALVSLAGQALQLSASRSLTLLLFLWPLLPLLLLRPLSRPAGPFGALELFLGVVGALCAPLLPSALSMTLVLGVGFFFELRRPVARPAEISASSGAAGNVSGRGLLAAGVAAFSSAALWNGLRAWLDPTPWGFLWATCGALLAFGLGWCLPIKRAADWWRLPLGGSSALLAASGLALFPQLLGPHLGGLVSFADPRPALTALLAGSCALAAFPAGLASAPAPSRLRSLAAPLLGAAFGMMAAAQAGSRSAVLLLLVIALGGVIWLVLASRAAQRLAGLALCAAAALCWWLLPSLELPQLCAGWTVRLRDEAQLARSDELLSRSSWVYADWGPEGAAAIRSLNDKAVTDVEGVPHDATGRMAHTIRFTAHLAPLLAEERDQLAVIGDSLSLVAPELLHHDPTAIRVSVAQPALLRALAEEDRALHRALLSPVVQLEPVPGAWLLRGIPPQDAIVHVVSHGWADASGQLPDGAFFRLTRSRLQDGGIYLGALSLRWLTWEDLQAIMGAFVDAFPRCSVWLPPTGADQLILVGQTRDEPLSADRLLAGIAQGPHRLAALDMNQFQHVAGRAVFSSAGLRDLFADAAASGRVRKLSLSEAIAHPPGLFIGELEQALGHPQDIWDLEVGSERQALLEQSIESARHFLRLLSSSSRGDPQALFEEARALRALGASSGDLDTLTAPQLAAAKEHIAKARQEGPLSGYWAQAVNELNLARLFNPDSLEPRLLLAVVSEAQGRSMQAESLYQGVLEQDEDNLSALFGVARLRKRIGDKLTTERMLRLAVTTHPKNWLCHQNLGYFLVEARRPEEAEPELRRAAAMAPEEEARPPAALAQCYLDQERYVQALLEAEQAIRRDPSSHNVFLLGRSHYHLQQLEKAEAALRRSVLLDPKNFLARATLGLIFAERRDYEQAAQAFRDVLAQDPGNEVALTNLKLVEQIMTAREAISEGRAPEE